MEQFVLLKAIIDRFPLLDGVTYVRSFASLVPFAPDTTFYIFTNNESSLFALVATDYIDMVHQAEELLEASGQYQLRFDGIVKLDGSIVREEVAKKVTENTSIRDGNMHYYLVRLKAYFG